MSKRTDTNCRREIFRTIVWAVVLFAAEFATLLWTCIDYKSHMDIGVFPSIICGIALIIAIVNTILQSSRCGHCSIFWLVVSILSALCLLEALRIPNCPTCDGYAPWLLRLFHPNIIEN